MKGALDFNNIKPVDLVVKFRYIGKQMKANVLIFPAPPYDLDEFLAKVADFDQAIILALDSKKAISLRNKLQGPAITMATQLGYYVESIAEDAATVYLSGFEPAYKYRLLPKPLPKTSISKVVRGPNSGTALAYIVPLPRSQHGKISYYELGYAPQIGGQPGEFTSIIKTVARFPVPVSGLIPGTVYAFRARAINKVGLNDWSEPVTYMAT